MLVTLQVPAVRVGCICGTDRGAGVGVMSGREEWAEMLASGCCVGAGVDSEEWGTESSDSTSSSISAEGDAKCETLSGLSSGGWGSAASRSISGAGARMSLDVVAESSMPKKGLRRWTCVITRRCFPRTSIRIS